MSRGRFDRHLKISHTMICTVYCTRLLHFACVREQSPILEFPSSQDEKTCILALLQLRYKGQI